MDMLVPLYKLPPLEPVAEKLQAKGIVLRQLNTFEMTALREFVSREFHVSWADEAAACIRNTPPSCIIAVQDQRIVGFAAYDCTARAYFGPTGVALSRRNLGIGKGLLLAALHGLRHLGYAYGIIGAAGPTEFYKATVGAIEIPGSEPGIYADLLKLPAGPQVDQK